MLRVVQQERRLAELERSAYPTADARAVLAAFKQTLQQMMDRRKEILLSLGASDAGQSRDERALHSRAQMEPFE